ncbi:hypothetical protein ACX0G9_25945 [Flavitalea flava]
MKKIFLALIIVLSKFESIGQILKENPHDIQKCEIGFLYYTDKEYPTFVPLKDQIGGIQMADFSTETLKIGIQLNWQQLALDTLEKYGHSSSLLNYSLYSKGKGVDLRVIPVRLYYLLYKYAKSNVQMAQSSNIDKFKLKNHFILIRSFGGLPIRVDSLSVIPISVKE